MNLKEVEKAVARIQSSLFKNANSVSIGQIKSHFKGSGLQFKEHQIYSHGDDVRFIDWKMLAKTDHTYIKTFEEERNVEIIIVIDVSPTMMMGHQGVSKLQASIEIACLLYLLAGETDDTVETIICDDECLTIPRSKGQKGMTFLVGQLEAQGVLSSEGAVKTRYRSDFKRNKTDIERQILKYVAKKREIVILSDFINFVSDEFLHRILKYKNIHCINIVSPLDEANQLPFNMLGFSVAANSGGQKISNAQQSKKGRDEYLSKKRFKKINIEGRYLEDFIKEMV